MPATPESRRLQIIANDLDKSNRELAKILEVSHVSVGRMMKGEQEMNFSVIKIICVKLGYSPNWLLMGLGEKKRKGGEAKLVTEIHLLRAEIDISANLNLRLQARLTGVEAEHEALKRDIEDIKRNLK